MTIDERRVAIAYADILNIEELIQHVIRIGACDVISRESVASLAYAGDEIGKVKIQLGQFLSKHTDFGGDLPKYSFGTDNKGKEENGRVKMCDTGDSPCGC